AVGRTGDAALGQLEQPDLLLGLVRARDRPEGWLLLRSLKVLLRLPLVRGGELADRPTCAGPARLNLAPPAVSIRGRGIQRIPLPRPADPGGRLPPARDRPHRWSPAPTRRPP